MSHVTAAHVSVTEQLAEQVVARLVDAGLIAPADAPTLRTALVRGKLGAKGWTQLLESAPEQAPTPRMPDA